MSDNVTGTDSPALGHGSERDADGTVGTTRRRVLQGIGGLGVATLGGAGLDTVGAAESSVISIDVWPAGKSDDSTRTVVEQGGTFGLQLSATYNDTDGRVLSIKQTGHLPCCYYRGICTVVPTTPEFTSVVSQTADGGTYESPSATSGASWEWSSLGRGETVTPSIAFEVAADKTPGTYEVYFGAKVGVCPLGSDSGPEPDYANDSVDVEVLPAMGNAAPTADAGTDGTVDEGATVTLDGTGSSDPDGDTLTYSWTQLGGPAVTLTGEDTATPSFTAPAVSAATDLTFELTVDDGTATDTDTVRITVTPDSGGYTDPLLDRYDRSNDGRISLSELGRAATDFANGDISLRELGQVSTAYANS